MEESDRVGFEPTERARQHEAEQLGLVERVQQADRQPAFPFDLAGECGDLRDE